MPLPRVLLVLALLSGCKSESTRRREVYECRQIAAHDSEVFALQKCLTDKYGWDSSEALSVDLGTKPY